MNGRHGEVVCVDCDQPYSKHLTVKTREQHGEEKVIQTFACPVFYVGKRFNPGWAAYVNSKQRGE